MTPPEYHFLVVDAVTGVNIAELPLGEVGFSYVLNAAGQVSASMPLALPQAADDVILPGRSALHIYRNRHPVWAGIIWGVRVNIVGNRQQFDFDGAEYWSAFLQGRDTGRFIRDSFSVPESGDQTEIAQALVKYAQDSTIHNTPYADLGIEVDGPSSGVVRDVDYPEWDYKPLGEAVVELASMFDGFDFRIDIGGDLGTPLTKTFRTIYPRQSDNVTHLALDNIRAVAKLDYEEDALRSARRFIAKGGGSGAAQEEATKTIGGQYIYREWLGSYSDEDVLDHLQEHADAAAEQFGRPPRLPKITIRNDVGGANWIGTIKPGDFVDVDLDLGYSHLAGSWRVTKLDVNWALGAETVSITLNEDFEAPAP